MQSRSWAALSLAAALTTGCTSVPVMPQTGTGSRFNLATVEYVESREAAITDRVAQQVTEKLPAILNDAIQDERQRIADLETALVAQQSQMARLLESMATTEQNVAALSEEVRLRIADLETSNGELRTMAGALSQDVEALPADTLRELSAALAAHLAPQPAVAAGPPPTPSPAPVEKASTTTPPSEFVDRP